MRSLERLSIASASMLALLGTAACQSDTLPVPPPTQASTPNSPTPQPSPTTTERPSPLVIYSHKLDTTKGDITEIGMFHIFDDKTGMLDAAVISQLTDVRSTVLGVNCNEDGSISGTATTYVDFLGEAAKTNKPQRHLNRPVTVPPGQVAESRYCDEDGLNRSSDLGKLAIILMQQSVMSKDSSSQTDII